MSYIHWPRLYNVILPKIFEVLKKYKPMPYFFISKVGDYTVIIMILLIVIIDKDITQSDYHL